MKVNVVIEKNETGLFSAYVEDDLPDFDLNGQGYTVEEAKNELICAYNEIKELLIEEGKVVPELEFEYRYDMPSLFGEFNMINVSGFAKSIGINPGLMRRYVCGETFASEKQLRRIESGIQTLGQRLSAAVIG
jgi:predicted RNase H-like HicB family nuclease